MNRLLNLAINQLDRRSALTIKSDFFSYLLRLLLFVNFHFYQPLKRLLQIFLGSSFFEIKLIKNPFAFAILFVQFLGSPFGAFLEYRINLTTFIIINYLNLEHLPRRIFLSKTIILRINSNRFLRFTLRRFLQENFVSALIWKSLEIRLLRVFI